MKTYNKALDYITLAMVAGRQGKVEVAAKLFQKAITATDAITAVSILETSNKHAFEVQSAARKAKVQASEEFDVGDDDMEGMAAEEPVEAAEEEDEDEGEDKFDKEFARVLSSMQKQSKTVAKPVAKPAKK
jgi:hypothetical protein